MRQAVFDLPVEARYGRADFLVSDSNRRAFDLIERWPDWPAPALALCGPPGCGKTHLAHLWCERAGAALLDGTALAEPDAAVRPAAVDNAERVPERALLHLYNRSREAGAALLLTLPAAPAALPIALPDLASRLRALPIAAIAPPDDELLAAVLLKHFADRQLRVAPELVAYLVPRIERSFAAAAAVVARLDRRALAAGRAVTVKLAGEVLAEASPDRPAT